MRLTKLLPAAILVPAAVLAVLSSALCSAACAQAAITPFGLDQGQTPPLEVGFGYSYFHANAPPAACGCFSLNGGYGTLVVNAPHGLSLVADLSSSHANNVDGTAQNLTLFDYLAGIRYSYRSRHLLTPYAEVLAGGAKELSNYTYVQDANAFGASAGAGVSLRLDRRLGWNLVEADYLYSRLPNAVNNRQSDLRVSSGIIFRFGPR